jgi:allantoinase
MAFDLVVTGTAVLPDGPLAEAWIGVADGRIAAIGQGAAPDAATRHDAGDALILPGVVDGQTHAGSYAGLPGLASTTRSAVAGGVTTIVDMPYDSPDPLSTVARLEAKAAAVAAHAHCDVALYATVLPGQDMSEVAGLVAGGVAAFKISGFESSPTRFPRIAADQALALFEALAATDVPLGLHNEDQEIVLARIAAAKAAGRAGIAAHSDSRPEAAELASSAHFLELGAASDAHAHLVHLSSPRGFRLVEHYRADGFRATGETCVHYLWFDPASDGAALGARMKVNPPIRPGVVDALWADVAAGRVAFVSSDHSSWPLGNKLSASIFDAGAGVPGLETLLPAFYTGAAAHGLDAAALTAAQLAERPARFFGLWPRKGAIRVGADADLVCLAREPQVWDSARAHDDLNWSPFDGRRFDVSVARTYVRGALAWDGRDVVARPGSGRYARRGAGR